VLRITQRLVLLLAFEGFAAGLFVGGPLGQAGLVLRTPQGLIVIALGRTVGALGIAHLQIALAQHLQLAALDFLGLVDAVLTRNLL
jgi:hypothetical protein